MRHPQEAHVAALAADMALPAENARVGTASRLGVVLNQLEGERDLNRVVTGQLAGLVHEFSHGFKGAAGDRRRGIVLDDGDPGFSDYLTEFAPRAASHGKTGQALLDTAFKFGGHRRSTKVGRRH